MPTQPTRAWLAGAHLAGTTVALRIPNAIGGPLEPNNVLKRFKATLTAAGLPEQRFHDLRHHAGSFLLAQGMPMRVVMDILGHSQMATTADLFSHVMPAARRDVADLLNRAMSLGAWLTTRVS